MNAIVKGTSSQTSKTSNKNY